MPIEVQHQPDPKLLWQGSYQGGYQNAQNAELRRQQQQNYQADQAYRARQFSYLQGRMQNQDANRRMLLQSRMQQQAQQKQFSLNRMARDQNWGNRFAMQRMMGERQDERADERADEIQRHHLASEAQQAERLAFEELQGGRAERKDFATYATAAEVDIETRLGELQVSPNQQKTLDEFARQVRQVMMNGSLDPAQKFDIYKTISDERAALMEQLKPKPSPDPPGFDRDTGMLTNPTTGKVTGPFQIDPKTGTLTLIPETAREELERAISLAQAKHELELPDEATLEMSAAQRWRADHGFRAKIAEAAVSAAFIAHDNPTPEQVEDHLRLQFEMYDAGSRVAKEQLAKEAEAPAPPAPVPPMPGDPAKPKQKPPKRTAEQQKRIATEMKWWQVSQDFMDDATDGEMKAAIGYDDLWAKSEKDGKKAWENLSKEDSAEKSKHVRVLEKYSRRKAQENVAHGIDPRLVKEGTWTELRASADAVWLAQQGESRELTEREKERLEEVREILTAFRERVSE